MTTTYKKYNLKIVTLILVVIITYSIFSYILNKNLFEFDKTELSVFSTTTFIILIFNVFLDMDLYLTLTINKKKYPIHLKL